MILWLGDLSYVDPDVNCFISQTSQLASKNEAIVGYHDGIWNDDLTKEQAANAFAGTDFTNSKQVLCLGINSGQ